MRWGCTVNERRINEPPHLVGELRDLRLPSFSEHWKRVAETAERTRAPYEEYLAELVHQETNDRRERRIRRRIVEAKFPRLKTLDKFDFDAQPSVSKDQVLDLARGRFVDEHANVVLMGGVGTGKTHIASALGLACCELGYRVRFVTAAELTNILVESKSADRLSRKLDQLARFDLVIIDELGYVPFDKLGADLLFSFITKVYELRSLIVTTNLPFGQWNEVFQDKMAAAAVIDRIVHHATILKMDGKSYRLMAAKQMRDTEAASGLHQSI